MKLYELLKEGKKATLENKIGNWYLELEEENKCSTVWDVNVDNGERSPMLPANEYGIDAIFGESWVEYND
ncbi:MAG: hypothetical protein ACRCX2_37835 [Paraclostridium sp.]